MIKKVFVLSVLFISTSVSSAMEGVVEKVKDNTAVVRFNGGPLEVGTKVSLANIGENETPESKDESLLKTLRARDHWMSWRYVSSITKVDTTVGSSTTKTESKSGELTFSYLYNWGRFMAGGSIGSSISDNSTTKITATSLSLIGQINLIENIPQNNFIPFTRFEVSSLASEISATSTTKGTGSGTAASIGAYILPFGEIFAIELNLGIYGKGDLSYDDSSKTKQKLEISSFSVGWSMTY